MKLLGIIVAASLLLAVLKVAIIFVVYANFLLIVAALFTRPREVMAFAVWCLALVIVSRFPLVGLIVFGTLAFLGCRFGEV